MKSIFRVIKAAGKWKWSIVIATVTLFVVVAIDLATPMVAREVIGLVEPEKIAAGDTAALTGSIWFWAAILLAGTILRALFTLIQAYFAHRAAIKVICKLRNDAYGHLQTLSAKFYSDKQTGQIVDRVYQDTHQLENLIAHALPDLIVNVITVAGVLCLMFWINPVLAAYTCIPLPAVLLVAVFSRKTRKHWRKNRKIGAEIVGALVDNIQGMKEVQVFNRQQHEAEKMRERVERHGASFLRGAFWIYLFNSVLSFVQEPEKLLPCLSAGCLPWAGICMRRILRRFSCSVPCFTGRLRA